ncbi:MAG: copper amine oxidase N-terminal domain-containing protein, partial [Bacillota bacterium]|nr:copper amine oxidase N-terminal domain-containing protein [Bacillota bacterium]
MKRLQLSKVYRTIIALILTIGLILSPAQSTSTFADTGEISVYVNGKKLDFDVPPLVIKERTLVPLRKIFEELGATVIWDAKTPDKIVAKNNTIEVEMQLGKYDYYINKKKFKLDVAPVAVNGRTLIPARAVSEAFGCKVGWDQPTLSVLITTADYSGNQQGNHGDNQGGNNDSGNQSGGNQ